MDHRAWILHSDASSGLALTLQHSAEGKSSLLRNFYPCHSPLPSITRIMAFTQWCLVWPCFKHWINYNNVLKGNQANCTTSIQVIPATGLHHTFDGFYKIVFERDFISNQLRPAIIFIAIGICFLANITNVSRGDENCASVQNCCIFLHILDRPTDPLLV